jgi:hypothetical protein
MAHYVNNKSLYTEMVKYRARYLESLEKGEQRPRIPDYVGLCILQIATRLATKPNFYNYSYKDEMISDGIENCINYIHNFDPDKSSNPFAYFTQIIYYAFLRRIQKEKKQQYIKHKSVENSAIMNTLVDMSPEDTKQFNAVYLTQEADKLQALVDKFEPIKEVKMKKKPPKGVEKLFGEEDD